LISRNKSLGILCVAGISLALCSAAQFQPVLFTARSAAAPPVGPDQQPVPGPRQAINSTVIAVISPASSVLAEEGFVVPKDALGLRIGSGPIRPFYTPSPNDGEDVSVTVGDDGLQRIPFHQVHLATTANQDGLRATDPFRLAEVDINGGHGAAPSGPVVASQLRFVDRTPGLPLDPQKCVTSAMDNFEKSLTANERRICARTDSLAKASGQDAPALNPTTQIYPAWDATGHTLEIRVVRTFTILPKARTKGTTPGDPNAQPMEGAVYGTVHGLRVSAEISFDRNGKCLRQSELDLESFQTELPPPG
jgi:hypothetical protein